MTGEEISENGFDECPGAVVRQVEITVALHQLADDIPIQEYEQFQQESGPDLRVLPLVEAEPHDLQWNETGSSCSQG